MIRVTRNIRINENELQYSFVHGSGPGGQHVNKVATVAQLRFDVKTSTSLPESVRVRLIRKAGKRMSGEGVLIISARRFRTQERNREDALERLIKLIRLAAEKPKPRKKTKPTKASRERRLDAKRRRGTVKRQRGQRESGEG